jgi:hypothetical protein
VTNLVIQMAVMGFPSSPPTADLLHRSDFPKQDFVGGTFTPQFRTLQFPSLGKISNR